MIHRAAIPRLSRLLEHGAPQGSWRHAVSVAWDFAANPARPVQLPSSARVIGVGGPTLGGSYKTPLVLALATSLATRGRRVAVALRSYRARVSAPRRVTPSDDVRDVGDEALFLARELDALDVPVVVGRRWSAAIALAALHAPSVLVDGLLQTSPRRLDWSLLVAHTGHPWWSGKCPPAGDLRASPKALLAALDDVVDVVDASAVGGALPERRVSLGRERPAFRASSDVVGVRGPRSEALMLGAIARQRIGLLVAIARPERVLVALEARGIRPLEVRLFGDHRALPERPWFVRRQAAVDLWVTTGKCATKLGPLYEGKPVWTLEHRLSLPSELVDAADDR